PWRETQDPYPIWLSEIILQQTQVKQGLPDFYRFIATFPTIQALAEAPEEAVLKQWQGLGYYSRARNLHKAARQIRERHGGRFPDTYEAVRALPGIGDYTAAAILSFAFRQPFPVIDGNVFRVVSRIEGRTEPVDTPACRTEIKRFLETQIDPERPDLFNQAMMEWGALLCLPGRTALCLQDPERCFFHKHCHALKAGIVERLPVKKEKKAVRERFLHYCYIRPDDSRSVRLYLRRRQANDIWKGLFDLPCMETDSAETPLPGLKCVKQYTHLLTHQRLHLFFHEAAQLPPEIDTADCFPVDKEHWTDYAVPKVIEKFLDFLRKTTR
ncbi:MAG: A/G-specific adenine glycosylase, partial [Bacteroidales bacterium]|nr:A/G-specific adenine glycosylase [Bacteroidales bacterium]